jgi:phosphotransferase system  glucose/maltose/N-acetylglucosamine-specific IIC component
VGPFLSGGLFSLASKAGKKGELLAFGVFGAVAFVGFVLSFGIRSRNLETQGWNSDEEPDKSDDEDNNSP